MDGLAPLPCSKIVFRTITRARDIQDGLPLACAFHRRAGDKSGLSVDYDVGVPDGCAVLIDAKSKKAILSLHVGRIRDGRLDVIPDTISHANIINVPYYDDVAERELAEQIATMLVEQSRVAWKRPPV